MYLYFIIAFVATLVLTVIAERILIPILKSVKMGQKILDIGPRWHKSKEGTPTMGGLGFIISATVVFIVMLVIILVRNENANVWRLCITFGFALLCGAIGFIDDYAKFFKKQNEGLSAGQKYLLQLIAAGIYLFFMSWKGNLTTVLYFPFIDSGLDLGIFYYVFAVILITGVVNSVNLTDGIDGLAASITAIVGAFFAVIAFTYSLEDTAILSALTIGSCVGFLVYNFYPARVFMGDTGSLFLGGIAVGLAFLINQPLIIVIAGIVYILETLSVMLQVASFKLTGKRIFKMSPIHHHFEMCGWSELKIVGVFSLVTAIFSFIAYWGLV
ncbi:MAG: phospho-N-acetylmuramoyl-pentapeptide-transferase [Ruminococcaceae bacterium]|nr:phospho-N-acetylmuramoyl-pentapeptide-transferase [Oscillospiraceae bacterium]